MVSLNLSYFLKEVVGFGVSLSQVKAEHLIHPITTRCRTIELHELGGLQVPVNVVIRVRHREGLHTHSGRTSDTLWNLNFELGVDAVVVLLGTVDDDVLVLHLQ